MGCCDSGGGGQQTMYDWNPVMRDFWAGTGPENPGLLNRGVGSILNQPYEQYSGRVQMGTDASGNPIMSRNGQRIADLSGDQLTAMQNVRNATTGNGAADAAAGRQAAMDFAQGRYLANPYESSRVQVQENDYLGNSPQYQAMKRSAMDDIVAKHQMGTQADTTRAFSMGNAFGGSAHQQAMASNAGGLGKALSDYNLQSDNAQYDRSAQLRENSINRGMQAQQFDIGRLQNAYQQNLGMMQGAIPLAQAGQGLSLDAARALMGVGDVNRSLSQDYLSQGFNDWQGARNWDRNNIRDFSGLLSQAQGGVGGSATSQSQGYTASPFAQFLGAAGAGYGMFRA